MLQNEKHEVFCQEYTKDFNASAAAKRAGYSEKNSAQTGSRLMRRPDVQERVKELLEEIKDVNIMSSTENLVHLTTIGRGLAEEEMLFLNPKAGSIVKGSRMTAPRDRLKALELVAKYHGLLREKHEHELKTTFVVDIEDFEAELLAGKEQVNSI